jgi:AraC-like DNA-binding protein/quercetin dioxygenase-like cupin family protein
MGASIAFMGRDRTGQQVGEQDPSPMDERPTGFWAMPDRAGDGHVLERLLGGVACSVSGCGWYEFPPGWAVPERVLPNHVAFVIVGGRITLEIAGARHRVEAGQVFLAPPSIRQAVCNDGTTNVRFYTVHFVARLHGVLDVPTAYHMPMALEPSTEGMALIVAAVRRIVDELTERQPGCALAANGDCARLLAIIWRESLAAGDGQEPIEAAATPRDLARLGPVFQTIHQHYDERLRLGQLAAIVHLEPTYFATIFKRVTGLAPHQYIAAYRLRQVRNLLTSTRDPIGAIAISSGYGDGFYLSRVFRRAEGMSPSEYRKSHDRPALP